MENNVPIKNETLAKKLYTYANVISLVVLILVSLMRRVKYNVGIDFSFLPPVHAVLNTLVAICLLVALSKIKAKDVLGHRKFINLAMVGSALFLTCYVIYHFTTEETKYCGEGSIRYLYFFLLITHIVLAAVSLPLILRLYIKGYTGLIEEHRRMAKWVYPIWLYVALSGPICYLLLAKCY
jgi:putative membrane protein